MLTCPTMDLWQTHKYLRSKFISKGCTYIIHIGKSHWTVVKPNSATKSIIQSDTTLQKSNAYLVISYYVKTGSVQ